MCVCMCVCVCVCVRAGQNLASSEISLQQSFGGNWSNFSGKVDCPSHNERSLSEFKDSTMRNTGLSQRQLFARSRICDAEIKARI